MRTALESGYLLCSRQKKATVMEMEMFILLPPCFGTNGGWAFADEVEVALKSQVLLPSLLQSRRSSEVPCGTNRKLLPKQALGST